MSLRGARRSVPGLLLCAMLALAGCSGTSEPTLDVTPTTGGVRGVVVDQAITPIEGVTVDVVGSETKTVVTGKDGSFAVTQLAPGEYIVRAKHPLYASAQQATTVVAGVADPPALKIQLEQTIFDTPYVDLLQYKGFIVCSIGVAVAASEECGEGVGVECVPPMQPPACGRVGGQGNNEVQFDFYVAGPNVRSILVEQVWTPNAEATGELYTVLAIDWSCTPSCGGKELNITAGPSPIQVRHDFTAESAAKANVTSETRFSAFTWPNWGAADSDPAQANVALNQDYELFVTISYVLPLPPGYSFVNDSPDPFT